MMSIQKVPLPLKLLASAEEEITADSPRILPEIQHLLNYLLTFYFNLVFIIALIQI